MASETTDAPDLLRAALAYAEAGVPIFPIIPGGKRPAVEHGLHDATTDAEKIKGWWGVDPSYNIGLVTGSVSGIVVVDIDGPTGEETAKGLDLPTTREVTTGKGRHLYFAYSNGPLKNGVGTRGGLGPGVDFRGEGGYVVAAPSVHENGTRYVGNREKITPLPTWVAEKRKKVQRETGSVLERLRPRAKAVGGGANVEPAPLPEADRPVGTQLGLRKLAVQIALMAQERSPEDGGNGRNHRLNEVAYIVGGLVASGHLDEEYATEGLWEAVIESGLVDDDGEGSALKTMESGFSAGERDPHPEAGRESEWVSPQGAFTRAKMLFTLDDLAHLPPIEFLIQGVLPARGLSVLFGPSGTYKSFLVLDWGLSIACGRPWNGRDSERGHVVYIASEGASGILKRATAWREAHPEDDPGDRFRVVPRAVNLTEPENVYALKTALAEELVESPKLVIVDTLARSMPGADENAATEMGVVVEAIDAIRHEHGATVLLVHHSGRQKGHERGSTALEGAMDSRYEMAANKDSLTGTVFFHKMKDDPEPLPIKLKLKQVGPSLVITSGTLDEAGRKAMVAERLAELLVERPEGVGHAHLRDTLGLPYPESERALLDASHDPESPVVTYLPEGFVERLYTLNAER